jgi:hypothetical protein
MTYKATNSAYNITVEAAEKFVAKLRALGFPVGKLHANGQAAAEAADYVPVEELAGLEPSEKYNLVVFSSGDWHNVAMLMQMLGGGSLEEFRRVCADFCVDYRTQILNIPGAAKAIEKLIERA